MGITSHPDWELRSIGSLTDVFAGGTPSTQVDSYWGGEIRWMNSGELNLRKVFEVENRITEEGLKNSSARLIPRNCVLIGLAGQGKTRGTVAINRVELTTNQSVAAIYPSKEFVPEYLYYNLDLRYNEIRDLSDGGGGRGGLNLKLIKSIEVPLPRLEEQKAIAKALSDIDELIEQTSKELIKQTNLFTSVSEELLNPRNNTEVKFESFSLGKIGTTFGGLNGKSGKDFGTGSEYVTFLNVMKNLVLNPATVDFVEIAPSEVQNRLQENDLVFNGSSETPEEAGLTSVVPRSLEGAYLNSFCFGFRFSEIEEIDPKYFALLSRSSVGRQIMGLLAQGSTRYNISKTELLKVQWPIPDINIQIKTVEILSGILSFIENAKLAKAKYECIKQGMAHDLLTGKVRLV